MTSIAELKAAYIAAKAERETFREIIAPLEAELDAAIFELGREFRQRHDEIFCREEEASANFLASEAQLREAIIAEFNQTQEKTIDKNLSVRITTKLQYNDGLAVAWAKVNAPFMVKESVDKKAFEANPAVAALDFVRTEESIQTVIKGL